VQVLNKHETYPPAQTATSRRRSASAQGGILLIPACALRAGDTLLAMGRRPSRNDSSLMRAADAAFGAGFGKRVSYVYRVEAGIVAGFGPLGRALIRAPAWVAVVRATGDAA
jgi:hypothetical protein